MQCIYEQVSKREFTVYYTHIPNDYIAIIENAIIESYVYPVY